LPKKDTLLPRECDVGIPLSLSGKEIRVAHKSMRQEQTAPYMLQGSLISKLSTVQWVHTGEGEDGKVLRWKWSVQVCKTLLSAYRWQAAI